MAEEMKVVHSAEPSTVSTGRKRGRPRKDESRGYDSASKKYLKADQGSHSGSIPIGQAVSGVLDGKFDAGYMLTVQVGNTGTILRGVVFEPGRFLPISASNDIAPHLTMVPRAEVSIPGGTEILNQTQVKNKSANPAAPSLGTSAFPGEKVGAPPLTGTFVVPVTLSSALPKHSPSVDAVTIKTDNSPSPVASAQAVNNTDNDVKNFSTAAGSKVIPQSGSADTAGQSSISDSKNIHEFQKSDDKKAEIGAPAIAAPGTTHQTRATPGDGN